MKLLLFSLALLIPVVLGWPDDWFPKEGIDFNTAEFGCYMFYGVVRCESGVLMKGAKVNLYELDDFSRELVASAPVYRSAKPGHGFYKFAACVDDDVLSRFVEIAYEFQNICSPDDRIRHGMVVPDRYQYIEL